MSSAVDPLGLTYWHLKRESTEMDWHLIGAQAEDFTVAFDKKLDLKTNRDHDRHHNNDKLK